MGSKKVVHIIRDIWESKVCGDIHGHEEIVQIKAKLALGVTAAQIY